MTTQTSANVDLSVPVAAGLRWLQAASLNEMDALEELWRRSETTETSPLTQFIWQRASMAAFSTDATPQVTALADGDHISAAAPLTLKRAHYLSRLYLAGVSELHEPTDFFASDDASLTKVIDHVVRGGIPLHLERVFAQSPTLAKLQRVCRARAIVLTRPQANCPYIDLDPTWIDPDQHLNAGRRSDLRRARRKAEQLGPVTIEIHTPDLDELPTLLDTAFDVESRGWKGDIGTALALDPHRAVFFRRYAQAACVDGILRICFLRIGDRVVAMQLAIEQGGGFWLLKVGYDEKYSHCSPGLLLMRETIRYAVEAGLNTYEFLGRAESWTRVWTKTERSTVSVRVYPLNVRGLAALSVDGAIALAPRLQRATQKARTAARQAASRCLLPLARRAARAYVAGERLDEALRVADRTTGRGLGITLGYWDSPTDTPQQVADEYVAAIRSLVPREHGYLSIKLPALGFSPELLGEITQEAVTNQVRLHCDALGPEVADRNRSTAETMLANGVSLSYTLPGRWRRSLDDAQWAIDRQLVVRVVKGQWADPDDPGRDLRAGFLEVIDRLAGRANHVAVASHDVPLAAEALRRLQAAGTSCELELLYGLPMRKSLALADSLGVGVHVYIPYGKAYLPYALSRLRGNPRIAWWLLRDLLLGST